MSALETFFLIFLPSIFAIVNPIGVIGPFVALTGHQPEWSRKRIAKNASIASFGILFCIVCLGSLVFKGFGISMGAVRIGGGLLLLIVGFEMVMRQKGASVEDDADEVSVFPLAMPLLAGPGSIVTILVFTEKYPDIIYHVLLTVAIAANFLISYLILLNSSQILKWAGPSLMKVVSKIMGFLVTCMAIQFVMDGVIESFPILRGGP